MKGKDIDHWLELHGYECSAINPLEGFRDLREAWDKINRPSLMLIGLYHETILGRWKDSAPLLEFMDMLRNKYAEVIETNRFSVQRVDAVTPTREVVNAARRLVLNIVHCTPDEEKDEVRAFISSLLRQQVQKRRLFKESFGRTRRAYRWVRRLIS